MKNFLGSLLTICGIFIVGITLTVVFMMWFSSGFLSTPGADDYWEMGFIGLIGGVLGSLSVHYGKKLKKQSVAQEIVVTQDKGLAFNSAPYELISLISFPFLAIDTLFAASSILDDKILLSHSALQALYWVIVFLWSLDIGFLHPSGNRFSRFLSLIIFIFSLLLIIITVTGLMRAPIETILWPFIAWFAYKNIRRGNRSAYE